MSDRSQVRVSTAPGRGVAYWPAVTWRRHVTAAKGDLTSLSSLLLARPLITVHDADEEIYEHIGDRRANTRSARNAEVPFENAMVPVLKKKAKLQGQAAPLISDAKIGDEY